jgi:hypothetical protein
MTIICPHCEFANHKAYVRYEPEDGWLGVIVIFVDFVYPRRFP